MNENEIEYINALTPFDHGVWKGTISSGEKITVGDTALFRSRSEWLVDKVASYLIDEFPLSALENMSLLEVGSYDGWVLTQICNRIKFSEAIGVEPRKKNIKKGEVGRKLAGIETQAKFIQGSADEVNNLFPDRDFDIVICLGMLHHVSSTYDTILSISSKSTNICIIDSMIIPPLQNDINDIEPYVNTRDIIYHGEDSMWSVAAYKYESPYGDGSRPNFGIVNIPSADLIEMSLRTSGFSKPIKLGSEQDFYDDNGQKLRGVKELLCVSKREISIQELDNRWKLKVKGSENIFCHTTLPDEIILCLAKSFEGFKDLDIFVDASNASKINYLDEIESIILKIISEGLDRSSEEKLQEIVPSLTTEHFQIMSVIFRSPYEKIIMETSKYFFKKSLPDLTIKYLQIIVRKPGCDWWSFYRSCYILRKSFDKIEDHAKSKHYQDLLMLSNENFPF
jgi:hypothetical protein